MEKHKHTEQTVSRKITDVMQLPEDLILGAAIATMTGDRKVFIENHRGLIEYSQCCIKLKTKTGVLHVSGDALEILSYSRDEILIFGIIRAISYQA